MTLMTRRPAQNDRALEETAQSGGVRKRKRADRGSQRSAGRRARKSLDIAPRSLLSLPDAFSDGPTHGRQLVHDDTSMMISCRKRIKMTGPASRWPRMTRPLRQSCVAGNCLTGRLQASNYWLATEAYAGYP